MVDSQTSLTAEMLIDKNKSENKTPTSEKAPGLLLKTHDYESDLFSIHGS